VQAVGHGQMNNEDACARRGNSNEAPLNAPWRNELSDTAEWFPDRFVEPCILASYVMPAPATDGSALISSLCRLGRNAYPNAC